MRHTQNAVSHRTRGERELEDDEDVQAMVMCKKEEEAERARCDGG